MAEHGRDRRQGHAGGDSCDAEGVAKILWAGLRSGDFGAFHHGNDTTVAGGSRLGPDGTAGAPGRDTAQSVNELKGAESFRRQRHFAPVLGAAFERAHTDRGSVQVDVGRPSCSADSSPGSETEAGP